MLLRLTTIVAIFLLWVPVAQAWSWPVRGPVLQTFSYDESHPYAAGQHRGIDIGATASGDPVVAPASGTVSFAGTVPTSGRCLTIDTPDGYSVTLTQLGSIAVSKGEAVSEGAVVGTVGPSGTPVETGPYVHLGIRLTADANGYLDPLGFLPALAPPPPDSTGSPAPAGAGAPAGSGDSSSSTPAPTATTASDPAPAAGAAPAAQGGSGLVIRAPKSTPKAERTRTVSGEHPSDAAEPARPARHAKRLSEAVRQPRTLRSPRTLQRPLEEPNLVHHAAAGAPPPVALPTLPRRLSAPALLPLTLAAGPGIVASLAVLATWLLRRRRRGRLPGVVVRYPLRGAPLEEVEMRRAA